MELSGEYRQYEKQFRGEFFNYSYEIERVQLKQDTLFVTKERTLKNLGRAKGWFADAMATIGPWGYVYSWYQDMHGKDYSGGKSLYGEGGVTPPMVPRLQRVSGYYMQPNVDTLFERMTDGTIYGAKLYLGAGLECQPRLRPPHHLLQRRTPPHRARGDDGDVLMLKR